MWLFCLLLTSMLNTGYQISCVKHRHCLNDANSQKNIVSVQIFRNVPSGCVLNQVQLYSEVCRKQLWAAEEDWSPPTFRSERRVQESSWLHAFWPFHSRRPQRLQTFAPRVWWLQAFSLMCLCSIWSKNTQLWPPASNMDMMTDKSKNC